MNKTAYLNKIAPIKQSIIKMKTEGESITTIAKKYSLDTTALANLLQEWGLHVIHSSSDPLFRSKASPTKYQIDFSGIENETEEGCYWLGFILADGYISPKIHTFELTLQKEDILHLEKFKSFLKCTKPLKYRLKDNKFEHYRLLFRDKAFKNCLISKGIIPRKSYDKFELYVPKHVNHFLRGLLDGDGCFKKGKNNNLIIHCLGVKPVLELLTKQLNKGRVIHLDYKYNDNTWTYTGGFGKRSYDEIPLWLKNIEPFYLDRKSKIISECCRLLEKSSRELPSKNGEGLRLCKQCNNIVYRKHNAAFCSHSCNVKYNYIKTKQVNTVLIEDIKNSSTV